MAEIDGSLTYSLNLADFAWGDLPEDEEIARVAAKLASGYAGTFPPNLVLKHYKGHAFKPLARDIEPVKAPGVGPLVSRQYGVRALETGVETWAPPGTEGPTRPEITVGTVRDLCGVVDLERRVAAQEAMIRSLQSQMQELQGQRVSVRTTGH